MLRSLTLSRKLMLPLLLGSIATVVVVLVVLSGMRTRTAEQAGLNTAQSLAAQIVSLRGFYTAEIAARARKAGMEITHDFDKKESALPLPATLVRSLGEKIAKENPGMSVRLVSAFPFPFRAAETRDTFEQSAIKALTQDPKTPYWRVEEVAGRPSMRYAVADIMQEGCVGCHNSHALSPKRDWRTGEVRGVVSVTVPIDGISGAISMSMRTIGWTIFASMGAMAILCALVATRTTRSIRTLTGLIEQASEQRDLTVRVPATSRDEVGQIAGALNALFGRLGEAMRAVNVRSQEVGASASTVAAAAQQVTSASQAQTDQAASAVAAVEELTVSVNHAADSAQEAATASLRASEKAREGENKAHTTSTEMASISQSMQTSSELIGRLSQRSDEISGIVKVIKDIADQTNLLALNAAIEAARAGEQGRGFAVVADEVRKLAERTGSATNDISRMIDSIQNEIGSTVEGLTHSKDRVDEGVKLAAAVAQSLAEINAAAETALTRVNDIAAATREQGTASNEIAKHVEVIAQASEVNTRAMSEAAECAARMDTAACQLKDEVGQFRV
jgi:methyl-accepting chemotaxis protein